MKKVLSGVLAASLALSSFASIAFGAELTAQEKFDALKEKGIFAGYVDGSAGLDKTMTRAEVSKVLVKLLGLTEDASAATYSDLDGATWAVGFIGAASKAGIMNGVGGGKFDPSGTFTTEQLAAVLARALDLPASSDAVAGNVDEWAKGYVAAAIKAGLLTKADDYTAPALRELLVAATYAADAALTPAPVQTATYAVVGAKKLEVKFASAVDTAKAKIIVKNGTVALNPSSIAFSDDKKTATLTFTNKLAAAEYNFTVSGVAGTDLTGKVTVADEKVTKISFKNDSASLVRTPAGGMSSILVGYAIYNQYNEDVTGDFWSNLTFTSGKGTINALSSVAGVAQFDVASTSAYNIGDKVNISAIHGATAVFASEVATVTAVAKADAVQIVKVVNSDSTKVLDASASATGFKLAIAAKDQYGNDVAPADLAADTLLTIGDSSIVNVSGGAATPTYDNALYTDADGTKYITLPLAFTQNANSTFKAGTTNISLMSKTTGKLSVFSVTVKDIAKADTVSLTAPTLAVANETFVVPFSAVDQFGKELTDATALNNSISLSATNGAAVAFAPNYVTGKAELKVTTTGLTDAANVVVTAVTSTNKVAQLSVAVQKPAVPTVIAGTTSDIKKALLNDVNASQDIATSYLTINDQYGRSISLSGAYVVAITTSDSSKVALTGTVLTPVAVGSSDITVSLKNGMADVANSAFTWTERVVDKAAIKSYQLADIAKLYQKQTTPGVVDPVASNSDYDQAVTVNGVLEDGTLVAVPQTNNYTINSAVLTAGGKLNGNAVSAITDGSEKTAAVVVTVIGNSGAVVLTKNVTYSAAAPAVATYALQTAGIGTLESDGVVSATTVTAATNNLNTQNKLELFAKDVVKTVDQYGLELAGGLNSEFSTVIYSNNSNSHTIANIVAGDTFYLTVISPDNAKTLTFKVIAK